MRIFDNFKSKNIDELAELLDEYGAFDSSPWMQWFDSNYCKHCYEESFYDKDTDVETICYWCEYYKKCKFFEHMDETPDSKQIAKMWLESEE